jgi:hypothetical protein
MNKYVNDFHQNNTAEATANQLSLACLLLFGLLPKEDEASLANCRKAVSDEYAPWLFPCILGSDAIKTLETNESLSKSIAGGGGMRIHAFSTGLALLMHEVNGYAGLSHLAASATAKMEGLAEKLGPMLDAIGGLRDLAKEVLGDKEEYEFRSHVSEDATDAEKAASAKAEQIVRDAAFTGEDDAKTAERIKQAFADVDPNAKVGVITIDSEGNVTGDLADAPQEIRDMVNREREKRMGARTIN